MPAPDSGGRNAPSVIRDLWPSWGRRQDARQVQAPDHQIAREDRAAAEADCSAALVALARLMGRLAAREHLAASDHIGETRNAGQEPDHQNDQDAQELHPDR